MSWPVTVKVKVTAGNEATVWIAGTQEITTCGVSEIAAGGVALAGEKAVFDNVKVGYDGNADDDIDDAGDKLVVNETFGSEEITPTYDDNGNLTYDGSYKYTYDAWNRLVAATLEDTDVVIQTAEYDGLGRRIRKVVTNSGDLDGTTVYYYTDWQIVETRDGSGNLAMQVYHGTRYIDEVVGLRIADLGRVYLHQDNNYNVTAMTDLTGRVLERYYYSPYGQLEVAVDAHPFDYDNNGVVDDQDLAAATTGGACWGDYSGDCRRLDADADRVIDGDDYTTIANFMSTLDSETELQRVPSTEASERGNPFGHQGLAFDTEIGSYQNRARQYLAGAKMFMQRDPLNSRSSGSRTYPDGLNNYCYGGTSLLSTLDPSGKCQIRWRRHLMWPWPAKYHVGIDIDRDENGDPDPNKGNVDYGWDGAHLGDGLGFCDNNEAQPTPADEWGGPKTIGPAEYPDGADNWQAVSDCLCNCLQNPTGNYGLYCLLGIPFPCDCSNSSGALHKEMLRCNSQCFWEQNPVGPPGSSDVIMKPIWINDFGMPGWENTPDGREKHCR